VRAVARRMRPWAPGFGRRWVLEKASAWRSASSFGATVGRPLASCSRRTPRSCAGPDRRGGAFPGRASDRRRVARDVPVGTIGLRGDDDDARHLAVEGSRVLIDERDAV
jgi:hypothetical protein